MEGERTTVQGKLEAALKEVATLKARNKTEKVCASNYLCSKRLVQGAVQSVAVVFFFLKAYCTWNRPTQCMDR